MKYTTSLILAFFFILQILQAQNTSKWVYPGKNGKLQYKTTENGDRIMDFSFAGYMGGGVAIPDVPVKITILPSGKDQSDEIQKAILKISKMPVKNGFRGAVLLAPGKFVCSKPIYFSINGIVLKGSGPGKGGTTVFMTGSKHSAFVIGFDKRKQDRTGEDLNTSADTTIKNIPATFETLITDSYVGAGTNTFHVADAKGFSPGDIISIERPVTAAWIHLMQMDIMTRDGKKETWLPENSIITQYREITKIEGTKITVKVPLADSYDAKYLGSIKVTNASKKYSITNVGIENMHVQCPPLEIDYGHAPYAGVGIYGTNCWVRNMYFEETMNTIKIAGNQNTIQNVKVTHTYPNLGASKPADFSFEGTHNLVDRCEATGGNTYFVWTGSRNPGPNVLLNSTFFGHGSHIQPHHRWSTGLLVDNCTILDGRVDFMNRGAAGSGHGWTMGWAVAWNCIAESYVIQNAPGTKNWAIGCIGKSWEIPSLFNSAPIIPQGEFDSPQKPVFPQSLYLAQLSERLGGKSLVNIGYQSNSIKEFKNKNLKASAPLKQEIDTVLGPDLGLFKPVNATNTKDDSREFAVEKVVDADNQAYWISKDENESSIIIDTEGPLDINAIRLDEAIVPGCRILEYKLEGQVDSDWKLLAKGTTVGKNKVDKFPKTTVWKVRLTILKADKAAAISKLGLYLAK